MEKKVSDIAVYLDDIFYSLLFANDQVIVAENEEGMKYMFRLVDEFKNRACE